MNRIVQAGSRVCLDFTLSIDDGTVADASTPGEPWCFDMGSGLLMEGLEKAILGMAEGETRRCVLGPEEAFGDKDIDAIQFIPRSEFPSHMKPEAGAMIGFELPDGNEIAGTILEVEGDNVLVDLNHPLAGHTVIFDVRVVSVADATDESMETP